MGRIAIVTGGASGIGRALGAALAARGDDVVLADRDEQLLRQVVRELRDEVSGSVRAAVLDVRDAAALRDLVGEVKQRSGQIDYLFNNAGIVAGGEAEAVALPVWQEILDVNLRGVVHGVAAAYPTMVEQGHGHLVNTAALVGLIPGPLLTPYATAAHAIVGLTLSLRAEAAAHGVRVSAFCPAGIDTTMSAPEASIAGTASRGLVPTDLRGIVSRVTGRLYPPEALAQDVLRDLDRDRALIVTPRPARIVWRLHRAFPSALERLLVHQVRRHRRSRSGAEGRPVDPEVQSRTP